MESNARNTIKPASPEFRALVDKLHVEAWLPFASMLDAMMVDAQNLRKAKGHKARERTLNSEDMDQEPQNL